jgi:hypothetical protein
VGGSESKGVKTVCRGCRLQRGSRRSGGSKALCSSDSAIRRNDFHLNGGRVCPAVEIRLKHRLNWGIGGAPDPAHLDGLTTKSWQEVEIRCAIEILGNRLRVDGKPAAESSSAVADVVEASGRQREFHESRSGYQSGA